ncbi:MAG: glycosyltransferase family 2 protein [Thermoplasmata archaeon]|nr:glycosyltransferase family 2 protein [Thermoplasmata archaeon]
MGTICVEVAVRDDRRLLDALASLDLQQRRPERVLIAASTATPPELISTARERFAGLHLVIRQFSGGVVDARAGSLVDLQETVTAFLDADEQAPPEWLARLVEPVELGRADFSGGPTRPSRAPVGSIERYSVLLEESIYADLVPRRVSYLPLQNTAWRTDALRRLGFDARIPYAEDHDLETRAARAGLVGTFVPDAWVYHDRSEESSFPRWARKRYRYLVAMAMSLMKNGELRGRLSERRAPVAHPLRYFEAAMKPFALLHASFRWRRVSTPAERSVGRPPPPKRSGDA